MLLWIIAHKKAIAKGQGQEKCSDGLGLLRGLWLTRHSGSEYRINQYSQFSRAFVQFPLFKQLVHRR